MRAVAVTRGVKQSTRIIEVPTRAQGRPKFVCACSAGPIGLLGALLTRPCGLETVVYGRGPNATVAARVEKIGARYVASLDDRGKEVHYLRKLPHEFGPFDSILEATGAPQAGAMRIIGPDGVLRLASVTGDDASMGICAARPNLEHVLGNRVLFGTVSANGVDFVKGVEHLAEARRRFPGWLTRRVPLTA